MSFELHFQQEIKNLEAQFLSAFPESTAYLAALGKRIRPQLFLDYTSEHRSLNEKDYSIAVGLELLHLFFLIHDDIMDDDDLRRDIPTIHALYRPLYGPVKANGIALVIGDLVFSRAVSLIIENLNNSQAHQLLFEVVNQTARGQLNEYTLSVDGNCDMEGLLTYYKQKTALYSFFLPLALAAINTSRSSDIPAIRQISDALGVAFQLQDDLIEFRLDKIRSTNGMSADILRGKVTPLLLWIWEIAESEFKKKCLEEWRVGALSRECHHRILEIGKEMNIDKKARELIHLELSKISQTVSSLNLDRLPIFQSIMALFN